MRECEALRGRFLAVVVACGMAVGERTSVADLRESAERASARDAFCQSRHRNFVPDFGGSPIKIVLTAAPIVDSSRLAGCVERVLVCSDASGCGAPIGEARHKCRRPNTASSPWWPLRPPPWRPPRPRKIRSHCRRHLQISSSSGQTNSATAHPSHFQIGRLPPPAVASSVPRI